MSRAPFTTFAVTNQASNNYGTVIYTGNGVPSYHSKDLVKWEPGPAVFKAAPEWIAGIVPENRNLSFEVRIDPLDNRL